MDLSRISLPWKEWEVVEEIGKGAYGEVYKVMRVHHGVTSYAAVKIIPIPQNPSEVVSVRSDGYTAEAAKFYFEGIVADFLKEIRLMVSLKGAPNIVAIEDYDIIEKEDEIGWNIYIRMELLTSLNDYIKKHPMKSKDIIKLGRDICTALELCGKKNIIHRDIKPENIFVSEHGDYKIGDFGISKELEKTIGALSTKGTYKYMAPEIMNNDGTINVFSRKRYDHRVDIYSLGIVLYKLLNNNRLPFIDPHASFIKYHEDREAIDRRFSGEPIPPPVSTNKPLVEVVLKACAFEPSQRYQSASEMIEALKSINRKVLKKCELCNDDFEPNNSSDLYCRKPIKRECSFCKKSYETICDKQSSEFCSQTCKDRREGEGGLEEEGSEEDPKKGGPKGKKKVLLFVAVALTACLFIGIFVFGRPEDEPTDVDEFVAEETMDKEYIVEPEVTVEPTIEVEEEPLEEEPLEEESPEELVSLTGNFGLADDDIFVMVKSEGYFGMLNGAGEVVLPFEFTGLSKSYYFEGVNYYFMWRRVEREQGWSNIYYVFDGSGNLILRYESNLGGLIMPIYSFGMSIDGLLHLSSTTWDGEEIESRSTVWDLNGNVLLSMDDIIFFPEGFSGGLAAFKTVEHLGCGGSSFAGYVDIHGNIVFGSEYISGSSFDAAGEAVVSLSIDENLIIINKNGERVRDIPNSRNLSVYGFSVNGAAVARDWSFDEECITVGTPIGLINKNGERITEFVVGRQAGGGGELALGLAPMNRAGLAILIDRDGEQAIINEQGEVLKTFPSVGEGRKLLNLFSFNFVSGSRLIRTSVWEQGEGSRYGVLEIDGEEVLPPEFIGVWPMNDDQWILVQGEEYNGIKDLEGNWLFIY